jgi:hypothetical protein
MEHAIFSVKQSFPEKNIFAVPVDGNLAGDFAQGFECYCYLIVGNSCSAHLFNINRNIILYMRGKSRMLLSPIPARCRYKSMNFS